MEEVQMADGLLPKPQGLGARSGRPKRIRSGNRAGPPGGGGHFNLMERFCCRIAVDPEQSMADPTFW
jgi:hypothetical protein